MATIPVGNFGGQIAAPTPRSGGARVSIAPPSANARAVRGRVGSGTAFNVPAVDHADGCGAIACARCCCCCCSCAEGCMPG